jgi:hypothetical protein
MNLTKGFDALEQEVLNINKDLDFMAKTVTLFIHGASIILISGETVILYWYFRSRILLYRSCRVLSPYRDTDFRLHCKKIYVLELVLPSSFFLQMTYQSLLYMMSMT